MSSIEPRWISKEQALYIHKRSIERHGGGEGMRDISLLESALARAENLFAYGENDIFQLAAGYAVGIVRNHPFIDGNKRTAYSVAGLFLHANGYKLLVPNINKQIALFKHVAAGKISREKLAAFYQKNTVSIDRPAKFK